jgi:hypothetical protein
MFRTMWAIAVVLMIVLTRAADAAILFEDDFEGDGIGDAPAKWDVVAPLNLEVIRDPDDAANQILSEQGEGNGNGVPVPTGWEDQDFWTDYVWEWDWMWDGDGYAGTAHRYQGATNYYHSSRRAGGASFIIYRWDGNWNEMHNQPWPSEVGVWYSMQSTDIGNEHFVKAKPRDDDTPFEELDPIVTAVDDQYPDGPIGLFGIGDAPHLFWDNIIVYEPGTNIRAVDPAGKTATTWARIKRAK